MIDKALRLHLLKDNDIEDKVGNRVYLEIAPNDTKYPCIVITRISNPSVRNLPYYRPRYQLAVYGYTLNETESIVWKINDYLSGYTGMMNEVVPVHKSLYDEMDRQYLNEENLWRSSIDFFITHKHKETKNGD